jgi:hypothetical protein
MIGHYQSLADNPGVAPESDQTCSLQSDQRTLGKAWIVQTWPFQVFSKGLHDLKSAQASLEVQKAGSVKRSQPVAMTTIT